jgi:hypothetical protein
MFVTPAASIPPDLESLHVVDHCDLSISSMSMAMRLPMQEIYGKVTMIMDLAPYSTHPDQWMIFKGDGRGDARRCLYE